jgi:hypothetical protein
VTRVTALLACVLIGGLLAGTVRAPSAGADDLTPTGVPIATVIPTVQPVTPTVVAPTPTIETRIVQERTQVVMPTATPIGTARTAVVQIHPPLSQPTPVLSPVPVTVPYIPPPSPEQLRESARLRWGTHVPEDVKQWAFLIVPIAHRYGVDPNLVAAVMTMESGGNPSALSPADARGLMQVLHGPWDPKENITEGVRMLSEYLDQFHSLNLALAAYNAGPAAVTEYNGVPPYRETRDYVIIVHYLYDLFGHRNLSAHRKAEYRSTLSDLSHFARERKKVSLLSKVAGTHAQLILSCSTFGDSCARKSKTHESMFPTLDPFWPIPGSPDPLHVVGPTLAPQ